MILEEIAAIMRKERDKAGLSYENMAYDCDVSPLTYFRLEHAEKYNPSINTLNKVLDYLGYELKLVKKV